jgi:hypothetical protein
MRRALLVAFSAFVVAGAFAAGAWVGQSRLIVRSADPAPISTVEARTLSDTQLRDRVLALLGHEVVEVSGVSPPGLPSNLSQGLDQVSFSLSSLPGDWPGLCAARVLAVDLETSDGRLPDTAEDRATVSDVRTSTIYRIVGPADLNGEMPTKQQCQGEPFQDGYFLADDSADASAAARFIEEIQAAVERAGPLPFKISCGPRGSCENARATLSSLKANRLVMVGGPVGECPSERTCLELVFETGEPVQRGHPPAMVGITVVGRYQGVGAKGWGILRIESVTLG